MFCSSCGHPSPAEARFCTACGAARRAPAADDAVRKTVSVVFVDLVGSTALSEQMDPEAVRAVQASYFDTLRAVLERHGATVEKFIGDAVMAVFGVPAVREDDALRAARAALEMRDALEPLNGQLQLPAGVRLRTRTGVNTGEVVVGGADAAADQRLATGDAVNVAARLQQAAQPGEILVGEATRDALRNAAALETLPPVAAKGKREPLRAWRLLGVAPDAVAIDRTVDTPFVGRLPELEQLRQQFEAAQRERACRLVTVIGTPGTGKSRLTREFARALAGSAQVLEGRCFADAQGVAYLPLAEVVRIVAGDDPGTVLPGLLHGQERADAAARLIVGALGDDGYARSPEETAWAFRRLFESLATSRPLLLVIDDIHWAEPALLDLIEYLVGFSSGVPIVVLCLARPDLLETRPSWAALQTRGLLLSLQPLSDADAGQLIDGLRQTHPLPASMRQRIIGTAEGNPLFVEQMLAMLAEQPEAGPDALPATIQALLAARVDRLPPAERSVLQRASVQGRLFLRSPLAKMLGAAQASQLGAALLALARKEFVRPDALPGASDDAFRFTHALIRDVAYASLTKVVRAGLHADLAAWLEGRDGAAGRRDEIVGHHLEQAWRYHHELGRVDEASASLGRRAAARLADAGRRALDRGEVAAASTLLQRAAQMPEPPEHPRAALLCELATAQRLAGSLEAAEQTAQQAVEAARSAGDELGEQRACVEGRHAQATRARLSPEPLRETASRAIEVFERHASHVDLADAWQLMGTAELIAGDRGAQLAALSRGREHAIASGNLRRQIHAWNEVGGSMLFGRTPVTEVLAFLDEELAWAQEHDLAAVEADALLGGPYLLSRLGRFGEARERLERSKALWRELGMRYELSEAHSAGAQMELLAGDAAAAERELREAIAIVAAMGSLRYESQYRTRLAHALIEQRRDDEARSELEAVRERVGDTPSWQMARARLMTRETGAAAQAAALARRASDALAGSDDLTLRATLLSQLADVLGATGDASGAAQALAQAARLHEEKGNRLPAQQCLDRLAALVAA